MTLPGHASQGRGPETVLSVRGEARRTVAPDSAELHTPITTTRGSKQDALQSAAVQLDLVTAALTELGGVVLTPESERAPLTWSAQRAVTRPVVTHDPETRRKELGDQIIAEVEMRLGVRDFELLDRIGAALAEFEDVSVRWVNWLVDFDNPAWSAVRSDSIHAAVAKARDYAAALGGRVASLQELADVGLLGADGGGGQRMMRATSASMDWSATGGGDVPSLDPVPLELQASVDGRFLAEGLSLDAATPDA
jgi:hypothetical protein